MTEAPVIDVGVVKKSKTTLRTEAATEVGGIAGLHRRVGIPDLRRGIGTRGTRSARAALQ